MTGLIVMRVGCPTEEKARTIGRALMDAGLARVFHVFPVDATYLWKGEVVRAVETVLEARMGSDDFEAAAGIAAALHPYETPSIIAVDIAATTVEYGRWLRGG